MRVVLLAIILLVSTSIFACGQRENVQDECKSKKTCTACIRSPNCTWCDVAVDEHTMKPPVRCVNQNQENITRDDHSWCQGKEVNYTSNAQFIENHSLSSSRGKQVQIQPQVVKLQLRQGEDYHLKVRYRQAEDYPVDLYFLVDLSSSMKKFRVDLSNLADKIVTAMENLTTNIQLGFGTFVDKNVRPMSTQGIAMDSWEQFAFENNLPLTEHYERLKHLLHIEPIETIYDLPESGLDGMMQAIVCKEQIGWRSDARHLLVHASDDSPHISGDGRLGGIVEPNDEECHLADGYYTHGELQDYPSLGQINYQARKNNINIIFATVEKHRKIYKEMMDVIQSSAVGTFDENSNRVVELISGQYEKLIRSLQMTSNSTSDFLDVKFFSKCVDGKLRRNDTCDGIRVNVTVEYDVVIKATDCPEDEKDWHQMIEIKPEGINERVIVDVELICGCKCSKNSTEAKNPSPAKECHDHGILDCGVCSCDRGYFGESCQCKGDQDLYKIDPFMTTCRLDNSSEICSGHGDCVCGNCSCHPRTNQSISAELFQGKFCECNESFCRSLSDGKICGGHGYCDCRKCVCDHGWKGPKCECSDDLSGCFQQGENTQVCNNGGECVCGRCKCDKKKERKGRFCEDCPSCPSQRCDEFKDCVECRVHKSGKIFAIGHHCPNCTYDIETVDDIENNPDKLEPGEHLCYVAGDDGYKFLFIYKYPVNDDENVMIIAEKAKEFPVINDFLAATLGVILLTLLLGLVILGLLKIAMRIHEKREFEKFEQERAQAQWGQGQNPLYRTAVTTFNNPTFGHGLEDEDL